MIKERIAVQPGAPLETDMWLDTSGETPILKVFLNGKWVPISGGAAAASCTCSDDETTSSASSTIIVNGTTSGGKFIPLEGEPTFVECAGAFKNGTPIMLSIDWGDDIAEYTFVTGGFLSDEISENDCLFYGDGLVWRHPDYESEPEVS